MSKPRARWWGYVRRVVQDYPRMCPSNETERREQAAIEAALDELDSLPDGTERAALVRLVFFTRACTVDGAAVRLHLSYTTARRWQAAFVRRVAAHLGLT